MMHRFEGLEGSLAVVLVSVLGTLLVDLKYIENNFSSYHFRKIVKFSAVKGSFTEDRR